jgi:hypothetical protein
VHVARGHLVIQVAQVVILAGPGVVGDMPRSRHRARTRALQEASDPSRGVSPQVKRSLSTTPRIAVRYPFAALPERNPYSFGQHLECF